MSLARKYRPQNLVELVGQDVLVKTLSAAITQNKIFQSYLFCGVRGVGKTTTARIIAKTINCKNLEFVPRSFVSYNYGRVNSEPTSSTDTRGHEERILDSSETDKLPHDKLPHINLHKKYLQGHELVPVPCEKCDNCIAALNFSHPDILEIDAASRTGVDDVRQIIESAEYKPILGQYKIFIIDEVHMLSKNAFNAFLKLLEEPPHHSVFIFATTEVHKIPLTIISRCQRFNLPRITTTDLTALLGTICKLENVNSQKEAIEFIASKGDGSARDALTLLGQAILLMNGRDDILSVEKIMELTQTIDNKIIYKYILSIFKSDIDSSLLVLNEYYASSSDFSIFLDKLLSMISYIAKKQTSLAFKSSEFWDIEEELMSILAIRSKTLIQVMWKLSYNALKDLKSSSNQLQNLEMFTLNLIHLMTLDDPDHDSTNPLNSGTGQDDKHKIMVFDDKKKDHSPRNNNLDELALTKSHIQHRQTIGKLVETAKDFGEIIHKEDKLTHNSILSGHSFDEKRPEESSATSAKFQELVSEDGNNNIAKKISLENMDLEKKPSIYNMFLKYLSSERELEILYFLLNKCEVLVESSTLVNLGTKDNIVDISQKVSKLANEWSQGKFKIDFMIEDEITNHKQKLKSDILNLDSIKKIKKEFADFEITDILIES
ncbi:MAG: DNA polymerase III subunit gamma/tau [Rickettsiaceae bacterium]|nr:DNA polymerase III subunit gamma/tau [Rickettsiaceae bacterium]